MNCWAAAVRCQRRAEVVPTQVSVYGRRAADDAHDRREIRAARIACAWDQARRAHIDFICSKRFCVARARPPGFSRLIAELRDDGVPGACLRPDASAYLNLNDPQLSAPGYCLTGTPARVIRCRSPALR